VTNWIVLRAAGVAAYVALFASVALGLAATSGTFGKRVAKASTITLHRFLSTVGLVLLALHLGGVLLDTYVPFSLTEVLLPFKSTFRPIAVGFGIVAMYATVIVLVSSWVRRGYSPRLWRAIHMLAVPAFGLALLHGVFTGTDTSRPWGVLLYVATGSVVVFLLLLRGLTLGMRQVRRPQSSPPSGRSKELVDAPSSGSPVPVGDDAGV
jgi:predicted ferric reductase